MRCHGLLSRRQTGVAPSPTRRQLAKGIQCLELTCGGVDGATAIGLKIYTTVTRPRTIGLRIGRKF